MADEDGSGDLYPEWLVAENLSEAVWLRLRRFTSSTLCERAIVARAPTLASDILKKKGQELAFAVRSALGYWGSEPGSLNAKVLTRYYALLQITIAEQVASPQSIADLKEIQGHTESGHGLWTIAATGTGEDFPFNYKIACRDRGHFYEYCRFRGIDLKPFASKSRPDSWEKVSADGQRRLVSLADLLRRIPELQLLIEEILGTVPLSFHIAYADQNDVERYERMQQHTAKTGEIVFDVPVTTPEKTTYISIHPEGRKLTANFLSSLDLPMKNIRPAVDEVTGRPYFIGDFTHLSEKVAWDYIDL